MSVGKILNAFRGRASRLQFWVIVAIAVPTLMVLLLCAWMYALSIPDAYENGGTTPFPTDPLGFAGVVVWFVALAGLILAFLAAAVRRLHDRDKAWWWVLIFLIVPDALFAYGRDLADSTAGTTSDISFVFVIVAYGLYLWGLVELGFQRGTIGDNRYGPDPLAT